MNLMILTIEVNFDHQVAIRQALSMAIKYAEQDTTNPYNKYLLKQFEEMLDRLDKTIVLGCPVAIQPNI